MQLILFPRVKRKIFGEWNQEFSLPSFPKTFRDSLMYFNVHLDILHSGDPSSIPGSGRYPREGKGNQFPFSCLKNPMDRGVWWATVHRVAKSRTWLKWLNMHACICYTTVLFESTVKHLIYLKYFKRCTEVI